METEDRGSKMEEELGGNKRLSETPPDDDCCPICFGSFTVPCRSNCGHWYCGTSLFQIALFFLTNLFSHYCLELRFVWLVRKKNSRKK